MKKHYDPYRTPPLWESEQPLDYAKDGGRSAEGDEHEESEEESFQDWPERPIRKLAKPLPNPSHGDSVFRAILSFFLPSVNDSPQEKARHRLILSLGMTAFATFVIGAMGGFEKAGIAGFARADSITKATRPLEDQITRQTELLGRVSRQVTDQLAAGTAAEIRAKTAKNCIETNSTERSRIAGEIYKLQEQYREYKGAIYVAPTCAEL